MAIELKHAKVATITPSGEHEIDTPQWNENHVLNMDTSRLVGRTTAAAGAAEEITVGTGLSLATLSLSFDLAWGDARYLQSATMEGLTDIIYDPINSAHIGIGDGALGSAAGAGWGTIAIGYMALAVTTSSSESVAIGQSALRLSTGYANTGLGASTGENNLAGSENTYIGAYAGILATGGTNNTLLGHYAQTSTPAASNEIVLGNAANNVLSVPGVSFSVTPSAMTAPGYNPANWNAAFSWGDHSGFGYALAASLGTAATANVTTSTADTTADRLVRVGDFGLGRRNAVTMPVRDVNSLLNPSGLWRVDGGDVGTKPWGTGGAAVIAAYIGGTADSGAAQIAWDGAKIYMRGSPASAWREIFHNQNILGTVTQSSGIPTGAVIERGSNANGEFVKFADGTMICTNNEFNLTAYAMTTAAGNVFRGPAGNWVYPTNFITAPIGGGKVRYSLAAPALTWMADLSGGADNSTNLYRFCVASAVSATTDVTVKLFAVGRWF